MLHDPFNLLPSARWFRFPRMEASTHALDVAKTDQFTLDSRIQPWSIRVATRSFEQLTSGGWGKGLCSRVGVHEVIHGFAGRLNHVG